MSFKTDSATAGTIGIDTGKYTLRMIALNEKGTIGLREKIARGRIAARVVNVPKCLIGIEVGMATHLVVEPQEVVLGQTESADRRLRF